jgi:hypothetical protein
MLIRGGRMETQILHTTTHILLQVSKNIGLGVDTEKRNYYMCTVYTAFVHNRN